MKLVKGSLFFLLVLVAAACVNSPRNKQFLANGPGQTIRLEGLVNVANYGVKFQALNVSTGKWETIAPALSGDAPQTKDNWYAFQAPDKALGAQYWKNIGSGHLEAQMQVVGTDGFNSFFVFDDGEATNACIRTNNPSFTTTLQARQNCNSGTIAKVYTCNKPPCTKWY